MWSENQSVNIDKLQPSSLSLFFSVRACRLRPCLFVIEKPVLIMWVPFVSRQTVNTRRPRVRQSDQLHQAVRNAGHSDHWTGSLVSVFPLDMTSVQLLAGKTTHIHTMKEMEVHKIGYMPTANQFLTWTHFGWFAQHSVLEAKKRQNKRKWLTVQRRRTKMMSHLLSGL